MRWCLSWALFKEVAMISTFTLRSERPKNRFFIGYLAEALETLSVPNQSHFIAPVKRSNREHRLEKTFLYKWAIRSFARAVTFAPRKFTQKASSGKVHFRGQQFVNIQIELFDQFVRKDCRVFWSGTMASGSLHWNSIPWILFSEYLVNTIR